MSHAAIARLLLIIVLGALLARSLRERPIAPAELARRLPLCLIGLACFGLGIGLLVQADLGTAPWDVLHAGLSKRTGFEMGLIINLVGLAVLPLWIPLKQRIGVGTVLNTLVIGMVLDAVEPSLPRPTAMVGRGVELALGILVIALGSGLYIGSGLGPGPRDGIMTGLKALGLSVRAGRTLVEAITLVLGLLLGGKAGIGTVAFLVTIGPLVQIALERFTLPPLVDRTRAVAA